MPFPSTDHLFPSDSLFPTGDAPQHQVAGGGIPKLRVPLEMGARGLRTVEQDSVDEVAQCVYAILATPLGSRLEQPEFGIEDDTFELQPLDLSAWQEAIASWEPRARTLADQDLEDGVTHVREAVTT